MRALVLAFALVCGSHAAAADRPHIVLFLADDLGWSDLAYRSGTLRLYNVAKDTGEQNDVAQIHPDLVEKLRDTLVGWEREMGVDEYSGVGKPRTKHSRE